jgi:hypothetical protein
MNTDPDKMNKTRTIINMFLDSGKILFLVCIGLMGLISVSCTKSTSKSTLSVQMTDAPATFNAVMIDLQGVEVTGSGGSTIMLNARPGIYNLLDFSNGVNTLIATGELDAGTISQVRLILGSNNTVTVDGVIYPLSTPSAMQSGLKCQVHRTFEPGVSYTILLDFDAGQSIVVKGNGEYQLKPVIRTIDEATTGSVRGSITPTGVIASVTAESGGMMYSSVTATNGGFLVAGLPAGTYDMTFTPPLPRSPVMVTGIQVTTGVSTNLGIVAL